ncbi:MAG: hypothetical protein Tsb0020_16020 [Haliangiales bacterium]
MHYNCRVTGEQRYAELLEQIRADIPGFRVVYKDESRLQRMIHLGLVVLTAGGMRAYLSSYQTTIGKTVYVTRDWDRRSADERYITMRHEWVHLRQFRRYTLPGMALAYLLLPLPMGLAWCRARLEMAAYAESIRSAAAICGLEHVLAGAFRERIVAQFLGPSYGWMWPFRQRVEAWYDSIIAELYAEVSGE